MWREKDSGWKQRSDCSKQLVKVITDGKEEELRNISCKQNFK